LQTIAHSIPMPSVSSALGMYYFPYYLQSYFAET